MIIRSALAFERYTMIPNAWARDSRISRKARGLLLEMMSHAPGWRLSVEALVESGTEGKDAVRSGLNELVEAGYLIRDPAKQKRGQDGTWGEAIWELNDPFGTEPAGQPYAENPPAGDPAPKKTIPREDDGPQKRPRRPKGSTKKPSTPMPEGWAPNEQHRVLAREQGVDVEDQAQRFRDRALAKDERYVRWDAAFSNWLRTAGQWQRERGVQPQGEGGLSGAWLRGS